VVRCDSMRRVEQEHDVIRLVNRRERRRMVGLLVFAGMVAAVGIAIGVDEGVPVPLIVAGLLVSYPGLTLSLLVAPRVLGSVFAQPWLDLSSKGLDYGGRQFVPWANVVAVRVGRSAPIGRRGGEVFVLHDWSPRGSLAWLMPRKAVPLAEVDPRWRLSGVTERVERWAPHVDVEHHPPSDGVTGTGVDQ
jgi:hypothetical protein